MAFSGSVVQKRGVAGEVALGGKTVFHSEGQACFPARGANICGLFVSPTPKLDFRRADCSPGAALAARGVQGAARPAGGTGENQLPATPLVLGAG